MSRNRWIKRALAGLFALTPTGGCKQQLFMEPADYVEAVKVAPPRELETNVHAPIAPGQVDNIGKLSDVTDFVRPPKYMKLSECIALALEQGNVGAQAPNNFGFKNENLEQFLGRNVSGTDAIRAFAIDPAIAAAEVERALSRFDARWVTTMQWQKFDQPVAAQFLAFQQSRDAALLSTTLAKGLPTGGVVGITASTDYNKFSRLAATQVALINPNYTPRVQFTLEQPLLRLYGVEINQISNIGPLQQGSLLLPGIQPAGGVGTEGILITRIRLDQNRAAFDLQVNYMLANVEAAYWNLYAAYYNLYAQEEGLRQAFEGYRFIKLRVEIGQAPPQDLNQIQAQFHRFQRQVLQARGQVLESERQLRGLLGLRSDDGYRIVPIDEPNLAPYIPDFREAAIDAIANRPELMIARQDVKFRQLDLLLQKNLRRPDLRSYLSYDIAGLGTRLGGSTNDLGPDGILSPGNAFGSLAENRFNSWTIGFRLDMPLGFRDANGLVRQAQLNLTKSYVQLRDSELKAIEYLAGQYRRVIQSYREIAPARAEREELQKYLWRIGEVIRIGNWNQAFFLNYLTVQQQLAAAIAAESQAIANYNIALAAFEFAKGTIQQYNNVTVSEGPLPPWVNKRAKDYIRERTEAALKLREQPLPSDGVVLGGHPIAPVGGVNSVLNLPLFNDKREPIPDQLPPPRPTDPKAAPEPRPLPGMDNLNSLNGATSPPGGAMMRPLPTFGSTPPATTPKASDFTPSGTVKVPTLPTGTRPFSDLPQPSPTELPPSTGNADFVPTERVKVPQLPAGVKPVDIGTPLPPAGPPGHSSDFSANGTVTIPKPKVPAEHVWSPPSPGETVPVAPPAVPPSLPPQR